MLGSNQGNKKKYLDYSFNIISKKIGDIIKESSYFISEAWKMKNNSPYFWNKILYIKTILSPMFLIQKIIEIEKLIGRKRKKKIYENRIIDIDILFYDKLIICSNKLIIPHPLLHLRKFVLEPMCEINPYKNHPVFNMNIIELLASCSDKSYTKKL